MLKLKELVIKARKHKEQKDLEAKEQLRKDNENQHKTKSFDERIDESSEKIIKMLKRKGYS